MKLDIADSGGQGVHTGRTGTQGGMEFEGFLIRLWDTGITGPGVATWNTKRPNRNFLADQFDGKCCKVKDNDVTVKSYQIGDVRRGAWQMQYREGRKLQGADEKKNSVPGL